MVLRSKLYCAEVQIQNNLAIKTDTLYSIKWMAIIFLSKKTWMLMWRLRWKEGRPYFLNVRSVALANTSSFGAMGERCLKNPETLRKIYGLFRFQHSVITIPMILTLSCLAAPSQKEDISYFWENSDLTEIIYLSPEMAPYSWTQQSWNNKFSRFAKVDWRINWKFVTGPIKNNK